MYQVGNPEIFDGNKFFPLTGIPMSNSVCNRIRLADWEPVPFAVAILMVKSFTILSISGCPLCPHPLRGACPLGTCVGPRPLNVLMMALVNNARAALKTKRGFGNIMADEDIAETWKQAEKLLDKGKTEGALDLLRKADPDGKEATTLRIAGKAMHMKATKNNSHSDYRKAASLLRDSVKLNPRDKQAEHSHDGLVAGTSRAALTQSATQHIFNLL